MISDIQTLAWTGLSSDTPNEWGYNAGDEPLIDYILEDKSHYAHLKDFTCPQTGEPWIDLDDDFRVGGSGGILMNIDFMVVDTHKFTQAADYYMKHGEYCSYSSDTDDYRIFWGRETQRRRSGLEAKCKLYFKDVKEYFDPKTTETRKKELLHWLRITGDHYTYLNYCRIERTPNAAEKRDLINKGLHRVETIEGFPRFWDGDYWDFKVSELATNNGNNLTEAKCRRRGFSYKKGGRVANLVNLIRNVTCTLLAYDITYLTDAGKTSAMAKTDLDWFENNTYWKRGFLSESLDEIELGYKKSKEGNKKYGFRSRISSYATRTNASKAIGGKSIEIHCEEAGKFRNLRMVLGLIRDNMKSGKVNVGTLFVYGTGGEEGVDWADFDYIFNHPAAFDMLPLENVWDAQSRHKTCGFFFSYLWNCEPFIDEWGNSLIMAAWKQDVIDDATRKHNMSSRDYTVARSQKAKSPSQAFINTNDNIFLSPELIMHIDSLKNDKRYKFYTDGWYDIHDGEVRFMNKQECIMNKIFPESKTGWHEYITDVPHNNKTDVHGIVREYYPPFTKDNKIPDDLYFISCDPYRIDKSTSEVTLFHSLYSFQVWAKYHRDSPYRKGTLVAEYCGRLNTMKDNDWLLYKACRRWNARVLIEAGTGETIPNFKSWAAGRWLMLDPSSVIDRNIGNMQRAIGIVIGDGEKKLDGLNTLRDFMYETIGTDVDDSPIIRLNTCYSLALLLEMLSFSAEGNFDRISSAIVAMFEFRKDAVIAQNELNKTGNAQNGQGKNNTLAYKLKRRILNYN